MVQFGAKVMPRLRIRGVVGHGTRRYALEKLVAALRHTPAPVLDARLSLDADASGNRVDANVVVNGVTVHVHAVGETMQEAIDLMQERLRARLRRLRRRPDQGPPPPGKAASEAAA